ncbi:MAG: hypothetical protein JXR73_13520 [Candidatus Omnitrophica bacterium]|nr:hypothetical protein [Candidatus Omnitrophota bacterium]
MNAHIVGINPLRFDRVEFGRLGAKFFDRSGQEDKEVIRLSNMIDFLFEKEDIILPKLWQALAILAKEGELEPYSVMEERDYYTFYFKRPAMEDAE